MLKTRHIILLGTILLGILISLAARAAGPIGSKLLLSIGSSPRTDVHRIVDEETGVVCYVIPNSWCSGDCSYTPAISCLKR